MFRQQTAVFWHGMEESCYTAEMIESGILYLRMILYVQNKYQYNAIIKYHHTPITNPNITPTATQSRELPISRLLPALFITTAGFPCPELEAELGLDVEVDVEPPVVLVSVAPATVEEQLDALPTDSRHNILEAIKEAMPWLDNVVGVGDTIATV